MEARRRLSSRDGGDLDGRPCRAVAECAVVGGRLHDRQVGRRHADRAHDPREDRVDPPRQRHSGQRSEHLYDPPHTPRESPDDRHDPGRSDLPHRAPRRQPRVAVRPASDAGQLRRDQLQHGQRGSTARRLGHRSALPSRQEPGSGLHDAHLQPAERSGHGVRGKRCIRSTARRSRTSTRRRRPADGIAADGSSARACRARRPACRATTAASAS